VSGVFLMNYKVIAFKTFVLVKISEHALNHVIKR